MLTENMTNTNTSVSSQNQISITTTENVKSFRLQSAELLPTSTEEKSLLEALEITGELSDSS